MHIVISDKAVGRFREKVRQITSRVRRIPARALLAELNGYTSGWANHYGRFAGCHSQLESLDGWIRRRLRQWLWVQWKTTANRLRHLRLAGVPPDLAAQALHIRSSWRVSTHRALSLCIGNRKIAAAGQRPMAEIGKKRCALS
jgi:RNA-directed DNA polymerase